MSKYLPIIITVAGTLSAALALPTLVASHPVIFAAVVAAAQVLHAVLPGIFTQVSSGK